LFLWVVTLPRCVYPCLSVVNYYSFCMSQEKSIVFWTISKKCLSDKDYGLISLKRYTIQFQKFELKKENQRGKDDIIKKTGG